MEEDLLLASFLLDREHGLEIALPAQTVCEATPMAEIIHPVYGGNGLVTGIMRLRDDVVPIVNLKKRLCLPEDDHPADAHVAVVQLGQQRYGLLVDDIRDVLRVESSAFVDLPPGMPAEDGLVKGLVRLNGGRRVLQLLDVGQLFPGLHGEYAVSSTQPAVRSLPRSRYVVVIIKGQAYGIPVSYCREITFLTSLDTTFRSGVVAGALSLRGRTIPVVNSVHLLDAGSCCGVRDPNCRVLLLDIDSLVFGMIVEEIRQILSLTEGDILPMPPGSGAVSGICQLPDSGNVLLLDMSRLIATQEKLLRSMSRLGSDHEAEVEAGEGLHHLITEHCYLVFAVGKRFAIELCDVQEIIDAPAILAVPGGSQEIQGVINLRGEVLPVVDLRSFYHLPEEGAAAGGGRLIICRVAAGGVALAVDAIVTIYKQEQSYVTPSLNPQLSDRKDTLDRLIEFMGDQGIQEHVLVVNVQNLISHHLSP